MKLFCSCCGKEATWLSMKSLRPQCQTRRMRGLRGMYDIHTGKAVPRKEAQRAKG